MKWINLKELALIHELVINATGGVQGIINPVALESALLSLQPPPFRPSSGDRDAQVSRGRWVGGDVVEG